MNDPQSEIPNQEPVSLRGFWALIITQFQGAFSDNVLKNLVVFVAIFGTSLTVAQKNSYGECRLQRQKLRPDLPFVAM